MENSALTPEELFAIGLLHMSEVIWMCDNGSMDGVPEDKLIAYVAYLRQRISEWRPSLKHNEHKDNAVLNLLLVVLERHDELQKSECAPTNRKPVRHIATKASASAIRKTLGISTAKVKQARRALGL